MTTQSTTTEAALEREFDHFSIVPFKAICGADRTGQTTTQNPRRAKCAICWQYWKEWDSSHDFDSRIPAPSVAPVVDTNGLAEWLDMLVTALKASQKYDYSEWGQFIMGAESWVNKLRAPAPPVAPVEQSKIAARCPNCNGRLTSDFDEDVGMWEECTECDYRNALSSHAASSPAQQLLHCSCGAACTPDEYAAHRAMGHDAPLRDEVRKALQDTGAVLCVNDPDMGAKVEIRFAELKDAQRLHQTLTQTRTSALRDEAETYFTHAQNCTSCGTEGFCAEGLRLYNAVATTPPSTLAKAAAEEIQKQFSNYVPHVFIDKFAAIIERCFSSGGEEN